MNLFLALTTTACLFPAQTPAVALLPPQTSSGGVPCGALESTESGQSAFCLPDQNHDLVAHDGPLRAVARCLNPVVIADKIRQSWMVQQEERREVLYLFFGPFPPH